MKHCETTQIALLRGDGEASTAHLAACPACREFRAQNARLESLLGADAAPPLHLERAATWARRRAGQHGRAARRILIASAVLAVAWTTPWFGDRVGWWALGGATAALLHLTAGWWKRRDIARIAGRDGDLLVRWRRELRRRHTATLGAAVFAAVAGCAWIATRFVELPRWSGVRDAGAFSVVMGLGLLGLSAWFVFVSAARLGRELTELDS